MKREIARKTIFLTVCYLSYECPVGNKTDYLAAYGKTPQQFQDNPIIHWEAIIWIYRPVFLWIIEILFALIGLTEALLVAYLSYKVGPADVVYRFTIGCYGLYH